jgi:hypothetical protein
VDAFDNDTDSEGLSFQWLQSKSFALTVVLVSLDLSADSQLETNPILVLKITTSDRFMDIANTTESMRTSLDINPRLTRALGYISLLVKIGTAISEVSVHSQYDF